MNISAYEWHLLSMQDRMEEPEPVECDSYEEEYDKAEAEGLL